ncbi:MAG: hypothetical protein Q8N71_06605, partial [candidate division Zixibacteria bacterium]|nr:hypothetical protein [candidate division Zixibacteria bacterium]
QIDKFGTEKHQRFTRFGVLIDAILTAYPDYLKDKEIRQAVRDMVSLRKKGRVESNLSILSNIIKFYPQIADEGIVQNLTEIILNDRNNPRKSGMQTNYGPLPVSETSASAFECFKELVGKSYDLSAFSRGNFNLIKTALNNPSKELKAIILLNIIAEPYAEYIDEKLLLDIMGNAQRVESESVLVQSGFLFQRLAHLNGTAISSIVEEKLWLLTQSQNSDIRRFGIGGYVAMVKSGQRMFLGAHLRDLLKALKLNSGDRSDGMFLELLSSAVDKDYSILDIELFDYIIQNIQTSSYEAEKKIPEIFESAMRRDYDWIDLSYLNTILSKFYRNLEEYTEHAYLEERFNEWRDPQHRGPDYRNSTLKALKV